MKHVKTLDLIIASVMVMAFFATVTTSTGVTLRQWFDLTGIVAVEVAAVWVVWFYSRKKDG